MIGLKRGTVKLVPPQKKWSKSFMVEKKKIEAMPLKQKINVEHIGSTAINNMPAKPIIDLAVGTKKFKDGYRLIKSLETLGYKYRPKASKKNSRLFFRKGSDSRVTHHLHVIKYQGRVWQDLISFRDYLNKSKSTAKSYLKLKKNLSHKFFNNRKKYLAGKNKFIKSIVKKIKIRQDL
ncbi:MAG: GrpB family protein [Candidatus Buchananbacteria bacterium]